MTKTKLKGEVEASQIEAWKKKYPDGIYAVDVDGSRLYFSVPNRHETNAALTIANADETNPLAYMEEVTKMTCIGGDKEKLDDYQALKGIMKKVKIKAEGKHAELKEL
jgi:hypothetical protein